MEVIIGVLASIIVCAVAVAVEEARRAYRRGWLEGRISLHDYYEAEGRLRDDAELGDSELTLIQQRKADIRARRANLFSPFDGRI